GRLDQLRSDAHPIGQLAHAALDHVLGTKVTAYRPHIDRLSAILKGRVASDDQQLAEPRQFGDDVLGYAVTEILLLRIAAHVGERQYGDGWSHRRCSKLRWDQPSPYWRSPT